MKPSRIFIYLTLVLLIFLVFFIIHKPQSGNLSNQIVTMNDNSANNTDEKAAEDTFPDADTSKTRSNAGLFKEFVNQFPQANFPMVFDKSFFVKKHSESDSSDKISKKFSVFLPEVSIPSNKNQMEINYKYIAKVLENEKIVALVYTRTIRYNEMEKLNGQQNTFTSLAIYDKKGKVIAEQNIAYSSNYEDYLAGIINKDLTFETRRFIFERAKDVNTFGYENNPVTGEKPIENIQYTLTTNGEIKVLKPGLVTEKMASK